MRMVWLFDVDGTLIRSYGTAREAFSAGLLEVLGIADDLEGFPFGGGMDPQILEGVVARHGRTLDESQQARFWEVVKARTAAALEAGRGRVLPGVPELLASIAREPDWVPGLLTGNGREMARLKLGHFGLLDAFVFGWFGDEAPDRDSLARQAVADAAERWRVPPERCVVVGDTERDVQCARASGAKAVAVATGTRTRGDLAPHQPDLLLDDLSDAEGMLRWARVVAAQD